MSLSRRPWALAAALVLTLASSAAAQRPTGIAEAALPLTGAAGDYDPLIAAVGEARYVLLGESTHGTADFYRERAAITLRLLAERAFDDVAIEAEWGPVLRLDRYVRGEGQDESAAQALSDFQDFPRWMWRNTAFRDFAESLRRFNLSRPPERRVGVSGLDMQDPQGNARTLIASLEAEDPAAAARAAERYACLLAHRDGEAYASAVRRTRRTCEASARSVLVQMRARRRPAGAQADAAWFAAIQGAAAVVAGEAYYRSPQRSAARWNIRDRHMAEALREIADRRARDPGQRGKTVVWAHNSHVGYADVTGLARRGETNLGDILRQRYGIAAFSVGFLTGGGTFMAAADWGQPGRVYDLEPPLHDTDVFLLREAGLRRALILLRDRPVPAALAGGRLQRAIGTVYQPDNEREAHHTPAVLSRQFDAVIYLDRTTAVTGL